MIRLRRRWAWLAGGWLASYLAAVGYGHWLQRIGRWEHGLPWEDDALRFFHRDIPALLDRVLLVLPWLGTNITLLPLTAVAVLVAWKKWRRPDIAAHLFAVELGNLLLNQTLKYTFDRPRPDLWEKRGQFAQAAFPSGHMIATITVYFTIAVLLHRFRGWRWPYAVALVMLVVSLYSRLYLGVHWPTDVLGGLVVGLLWLAASLVAFPESRAVPRAAAPSRD